MENTDLLAEVDRQLDAYAHAKARAAEIVAEAKTARDEAIRHAAPVVRQVELVRRTGLTRESIRRIVSGQQ